MAASALLSAVLGTVSNEAGTLARSEFKLLWGAKDELERLRNTLALIQSFLDDAERKQYSENSVRLWLQYLKDVAYDVQDIIDEAATEALRRRVETAFTCWPRQVTKRFLSCSVTIPVVFNYIVARKIKGIREKLDQILKEGYVLGLERSIGWQTQILEIVSARPPRETSSTVVEPLVVGRSQELENLVQMLLSPDTSNESVSDSCRTPFSVISIVGMGGLGKTTLAQLVYNDKRVDMHFDMKIWLFVSAKFEVIRLIHEIIVSVTKQKSNYTTLDELQTCLGRELSGKRFLLVLDDVWNEDRKLWQDLSVPLSQGRYGSKVLITTRNQTAADTAAPMIPIPLSTLSDNECWSILRSIAFADRRADHIISPRLENLGKKIAGKAKGVPLAAKALGGILKSLELDENRWIDILNADLSRLREEEAGIMPVLRYSYQHLPPHLKQCFAYCAVFPKGRSIGKDKLIGMWMALGFISQGDERMEDVASDYFNALLGRSFFQFLDDRYSMHDLMHDLAQAVSGDECFIIENHDLEKVPEKVRHLTLHTIKLEMLEKLHKFRKLQSLLFFCKYKSSFTPVLDKLFKKLKTLRVLDLDCYDISPTRGRDGEFCFCCLLMCGALCCTLCGALCGKLCGDLCFLCGALCCTLCRPDGDGELPSCMGSLKRLRYLHLSFRSIHVLPESLGTLYNLQTLMAANCKSLHQLPKRMSNLVNLRQLKANANLVSNIAGIGNLTSLQELKKFSVGRGSGHRIRELRNLKHIRGRLSISKLENVSSEEEAAEAKLDDKHYIDTLELEWSESSSMNSRLDEGVLAGLKPHANLKDLIIRNFGGVRFTGWIQNQLPHFLENVRLLKCSQVEILPPRKCSSMNSRLDEGVLAGLKPHANLKDLIIRNFGGVRFTGWIQNQLPHFLENVRLLKCSQVEILPPLGQLRFLKLLEVKGMERMERLDALKGFSSLNELVFTDMLRWEEWSGVEDGQYFPCLRRLVICNCPKLRELPPLPPSLTELKLVGVGLFSLPVIRGCPLKTELSSKSSLPPPAAVTNAAAAAPPSQPATTETSLSLTSSTHPVPEIVGELMLYDLGEFSKLKGLLGLAKDDLSPSASSSFSSLSTLEISKCPNLRSLREGLLQQELGMLNAMRISECEGLVELPEYGLPFAIQLLIIKQCPLLKERCLDEGGRDWTKIAHIPYIQIDGEWVQGAEIVEAFNKVYENFTKGFEGSVSNYISNFKEEHTSEGSTSMT